jgi:hypothetical protein
MYTAIIKNDVSWRELSTFLVSSVESCGRIWHSSGKKHPGSYGLTCIYCKSTRIMKNGKALSSMQQFFQYIRGKLSTVKPTKNMLPKMYSFQWDQTSTELEMYWVRQYFRRWIQNNVFSSSLCWSCWHSVSYSLANVLNAYAISLQLVLNLHRIFV